MISMHDPVYLFFKTSIIAKFVNPAIGYLLAWIVSYEEVRKEEPPAVSSIVATVVGLAGLSIVFFLEMVLAELILNLQ
mgnify:CR=1 FL=1